MVYKTSRSEEEQVALRGKIERLIAARQAYGELPLPSALNGIAYRFLEKALTAEWDLSGRPPLKFGQGIEHSFRVLIQIPEREEPTEFTVYLEEPAQGNTIFTSTAVVEAYRFWRQARYCCTIWMSSTKENKNRILRWSKNPALFARARSMFAPHFINAWSSYLPFIPLIKLMRA